MTPGTYVSGEAVSIAPLAGQADRATYLPPNSAANASFLETLRLTLVHETDAASGQPEGLQLGYATPRRWLSAGSTIAVQRLPTSFGPLSFTIRARGRALLITLSPPPRTPASLSLRLRLPVNERIRSVELDGRPWQRLNRRSATIDLSGLRRPATLGVSLS